MDVARARYLVSPAGRLALNSAPRDAAALAPHRLADLLRKHLPPEAAAAVAEQLTLRERARPRLGATRLLLSADGFEAMTHPLVARRRAERLQRIGLPVVDLTAGLGGDVLACIDAEFAVLGVELDEATAVLGAANSEGRIVRGDALRAPADIARHSVIVDPSRRHGGRRSFDPAAFTPSWDVAMELAQTAHAGVVKGPPGIDHDRVPASAEIEFVQLGRSLRESALWFGKGAVPGLRRAVLLPSGATLSSTGQAIDAATASIEPFVFDPESCVTRAGLVRQLGAQLGAHLLDPQVAYLSGSEAVIHPLAATFEVLDVLPFSVGRLKALLRVRGWHADEIRRRAFPVEPDELRRLLGKQSGERVALICTTIESKRTVIVARRLI